MKKLAGVVLTTTLSLATAAAFATQPVRDVSTHRHPNIAAAQRLTDQAYHRIVAAQQANEWDMDGHAAKAKDLLDQASRELKAAAAAANRHHG
ncbi:hypothetical protein [Rhodanobacter geophilus]|uniref:Uncharacterized protein n=1 Tax=Rhodanobacter geophilus TaxID=3162488 RepID=A0ABV3QSQ3_9GAMM